MRNYSSHNSKKSQGSLRGYARMFNPPGNLTNIRVSGVLPNQQAIGISGDYSQATDTLGMVQTSHMEE